MAFKELKYTFPHESKIDPEDVEIEIEGSSAEEIDLSDPKPKVEDDDDLDYEIVDDTPEEDRNRTPAPAPDEVTDDELESYSDKVRTRIKHFSKGYHDERRAKEQALREREELENLARKLVEENKRLQGDVGKGRSAMIEQAKRAVANDLEKAKREYREAYEAGNTDGVLEAQEKLTTARLRQDKLNNFRAPSKPSQDMVQRPQEPDKQQQAQPSRAAPQSAPIDDRVAAWAKDNPWFGQDEEMTSFSLGLDSKLKKQGIDPRSDEYYEKVNARMREVFPGYFGEEKKKSGNKSVVAPATRSRSQKKVRLTASQVRIAKRLNVPLKQYAEQYAEELRKAEND